MPKRQHRYFSMMSSLGKCPNNITIMSQFYSDNPISDIKSKQMDKSIRAILTVFLNKGILHYSHSTIYSVIQSIYAVPLHASKCEKGFMNL